MSGGYFNYTQYRISQAADDIALALSKEGSSDVNDWGDPVSKGWNENVLERFLEAQMVLELAAGMLHEVDYLLSGDTGEDSFVKRFDEHKREHKRKIEDKYNGRV